MREGVRIVVASTMLAILAWLTINPIVTSLSPTMSPPVQSLMIGHGQLGIAFFILLGLYYPLHIFLESGFNRVALGKVGRPFKGLAFLIATFSMLDVAFPISPYAVIPVIAVAFLAYELTRRRARWLRLLDLALIGILTSMTVTGTEDQLIRFFAFSIVFLGLFGVLKVVYLFLARRPIGSQQMANLRIWTALAMAPLAAMMAFGTNDGKYSIFPRNDVFHWFTAFAFVAVIAGHVIAMARRFRSGGRSLVSLPIVLVVLALCGALEARNYYHYRQFAPEPVDTETLVPTRASPFTNVMGYPMAGRDDWFAARSETCANPRCHQELSPQHNLSAHGRAFTNDVFQWQLEDFIAQMGRDSADYCIACHAPLGVIQYPGDGSRGKIVDPATATDPSFTIGVGCVVCHRAVAERDPAKIGDASLTIRPLWLEKERYLGEEDSPRPPPPDRGTTLGFLEGLADDFLSIEYLMADGSQGDSALHKFLIRAAIPLHKKTYHIDRADWDDICGACHVVRLPANLSVDGKERIVADHYFSFMDSPYKKAGIGCSRCHQQRMETFEAGYNSVSHSYLGSGASLPYDNAADDEKFRALSAAYLDGIGDIGLEAIFPADLPPCIDDIPGALKSSMLLRERGDTNAFVTTNGGLSQRDLLSVALEVQDRGPGGITLAVTTSNACVGHTFPAGGGIKGYLEVLAYDGPERVVGRYGGLDDRGLPIMLPTVLGTQAADQMGNVIADRRFWEASKLVYSRTLLPGIPQTDVVKVSFPEGTTPNRVVARWYFLRPEYYRNRERGLSTPVPPVMAGQADLLLGPQP